MCALYSVCVWAAGQLYNILFVHSFTVFTEPLAIFPSLSLSIVLYDFLFLSPHGFLSGFLFFSAPSSTQSDAIPRRLYHHPLTLYNLNNAVFLFDLSITTDPVVRFQRLRKVQIKTNDL